MLAVHRRTPQAVFCPRTGGFDRRPHAVCGKMARGRPRLRRYHANAARNPDRQAGHCCEFSQRAGSRGVRSCILRERIPRVRGVRRDLRSTVLAHQRGPANAGCHRWLVHQCSSRTKTASEAPDLRVRRERAEPGGPPPGLAEPGGPPPGSGAGPRTRRLGLRFKQPDDGPARIEVQGGRQRSGSD